MSENSLKAKTAKGIFWSSIEHFSTQGISFIFSLFLARLLSPHDYGVIGMLSIFLCVMSSFIDSGFSNALIHKQDRTEVDNSTTFYFNVIVGFLVYCLLFFASPYIASFYNMPILSSLTKVLALNLIFSSFCIVQQALLSIKIDFKTQAKISLICTIVSGIIGISFAYYGFGVWSLVALNVSSGCLRMILLWIIARWVPTEKFSWESFKILFSYGSKLLASGLLATIYENIYPLIIGKFYTASSLGLYSRAQAFASLPSSNATGILQRVTFPVLSSIQDEDNRLRNNYRKILRMSAFVIFPIMTLMAAVAGPMVDVLISSKWSGCVIYLQIICFAMMWYPIHAINLNLLQVRGRTDLFLKLEIVKKILGILILIITLRFGLVIMCLGQVVGSFISLIINTYYTGKLINMGFIKQMRDIMPIFFNSILMASFAYLIVALLPYNLLRLVVASLFGLIFYLFSAYLFKSPEFTELVRIIKKR